MPRLGCDFGQGLEHETALVHGGMWMVRPLALTIESPNRSMSMSMCTRAFFLNSPPSHFLLYVEQGPASSCRGIFSVSSRPRNSETRVGRRIPPARFRKTMRRPPLCPACPGDRWPHSNWRRGRQHSSPAKDRPRLSMVVTRFVAFPEKIWSGWRRDAQSRPRVHAAR